MVHSNLIHFQESKNNASAINMVTITPPNPKVTNKFGKLKKRKRMMKKPLDPKQKK